MLVFSVFWNHTADSITSLTSLCVVVQSSGTVASDTLMTAMSRLATEHKADRATKDNPHRKRKSAEAFPSNPGVGIAKLNPNSKVLPPLSMGQQQSRSGSGALQQPSFQGSLVSAAQAQSVMHRQSSGSQPPVGLPQNSLEAQKRVKLEQTATNSSHQAQAKAAVSKQTSGSKQITASKQTSLSKKRSGSRQSSDDAQTNTEGASQPMASYRLRQQVLTADTVTSAAAPQQPTGLPGSSDTHRAPQLPEQQVSFPFKLVMPRAAQPAPDVSSSALNEAHMTVAAPASQSGAQQPSATQLAASPPTASQSVAKQEESEPSASVDGENCMAALAEAAAAASEGSAASSSSHAHSDDDQDAAATLRELQNSAGPPQQTSSAEGQPPYDD